MCLFKTVALVTAGQKRLSILHRRTRTFAILARLLEARRYAKADIPEAASCKCWIAQKPGHYRYRRYDFTTLNGTTSMVV